MYRYIRIHIHTHIHIHIYMYYMPCRPKDPMARISPYDALAHPWLKEDGTFTGRSRGEFHRMGFPWKNGGFTMKNPGDSMGKNGLMGFDRANR